MARSGGGGTGSVEKRLRGGDFRGVGVIAATSLIRAYQRFVSPLLSPSCRYTPTCSAYAVTAIERHGLVRGGALAVGRLLRCHPLHVGGYDPVPERAPSRAAIEEGTR